MGWRDPDVWEDTNKLRGLRWLIPCGFILAVVIWVMHWFVTCYGPEGQFRYQTFRLGNIPFTGIHHWGHHRGLMWAEAGQKVYLNFELKLEPEHIIPLINLKVKINEMD